MLYNFPFIMSASNVMNIALHSCNYVCYVHIGTVFTIHKCTMGAIIAGGRVGCFVLHFFSIR